MSDTFLEHYGVKGMKWGVRRNKVQRMAGKDAQEFARAKMFFGEGAGTRRKLIREKVSSRRNTVKGYGEAFDSALAKEDLGRHGDKAVSERKRKDVVKTNKQRAGAIARKATGEWGTQAAFVSLAASGLAFSQSPKGQRIMKDASSKARSMKNSSKQKAGADYLADYFKRNG